jgi:hypothetical protein
MKLYSINNSAARKVLGFVKKGLKTLKPADDPVTLEVYTNCREQGFALHRYTGDRTADRKVAFSEHRRSDMIAVYFGGREDFEFNTNIPSDEVYKNARFFQYDQHEKAAKFVLDWLAGRNPRAA